MRSAWYLLLFLAACGPHAHEVEYTAIPMSDSIANGNQIDEIIAPYRDSLELTMDMVLVRNKETLTRGIPESTLGNLVADLLLERALVELPDSIRPLICLVNIGGLRVDLPEGPITVRKVFELMPFENEVDIIKLSPEKVAEMLAYLGEVGGQPVAGIDLRYNSSTKKVSVEDEAFDPDQYIYVVTSDYLAEGGDKMNFFKDPLDRIRTGIKIRDAIIDDFRTLGLADKELVSELDGRISVIKFQE